MGVSLDHRLLPPHVEGWIDQQPGYGRWVRRCGGPPPNRCPLLGRIGAAPALLLVLAVLLVLDVAVPANDISPEISAHGRDPRASGARGLGPLGGAQGDDGYGAGHQ